MCHVCSAVGAWQATHIHTTSCVNQCFASALMHGGCSANRQFNEHPLVLNIQIQHGDVIVSQDARAARSPSSSAPRVVLSAQLRRRSALLSSSFRSTRLLCLPRLLLRNEALESLPIKSQRQCAHEQSIVEWGTASVSKVSLLAYLFQASVLFP